LNILIKPTGLLVENIIQDYMGHDAYGTFAALNALAFLFIVLLDLGINQFLTKELAANDNGVSGSLSSYFSLKITLSLLYPFFMIFIGFLFGYSLEKIVWLFFISIGYCFFQLSMYLRAKFQALQKFNLDSIASILDKLFLIIFSLVLLFTTVSITNYIGVRFVAMLLTLLILIVPASKLFSIDAFKFKWDTTSWLRTLKKTYPFALITILYSIHDKVDQVMIERMIGEHASGLYAAAYRWLDAFMMYLWIVLPMFFARFSYVKNNTSELNHLLKGGQVLAALPMIFVSIFVWFHGDQLFFLLKNSNPSEVIEMTLCLKVLFIAAFIHAYFAIFGTLLSAIGGEHFLNKMMLFTIVLNIGLNLYLIPQMGIAGAAWATSMSTLFLSVAYIFKLVHYKIYILDIGILIKLIFFSIIIYGVFHLGNTFELSWFVSTIFVSIVAAFFVFSSGLYKLLLKQ
jgi:O-antigen/teichoic acid export membrane protein